jgi:hypothetical protein
MEIFSSFLNLIGILILIIIIILITREIWTWFFKFNLMVEQNNEIIKLLKKIADNKKPVKTGESEKIKANEDH